eukprot:12127190-Alexandrium_andersonii.AAC.1
MDDGGIRAKTAEYLRHFVATSLPRFGNASIAGITTDDASNTKKMRQYLHDELSSTQRGPCASLYCGEHAAQLLSKDLSKAIPWLEDLPVALRLRFAAF